MKNKKSFELPYLGIAHQHGMDALYGKRGDYSAVIKMENAAYRFCADGRIYERFHHLLLNIIKVLGEGYIIQKQDVFARRIYQGEPSRDYLQQSYNEHFQGRTYLEVSTYLIITREVKKGAFYVYDEKASIAFSQKITKIMDLLSQAHHSPTLLGRLELEGYIRAMLSMDFSSTIPSLENIRAKETVLEMGDKQIKSISLVDVESIDLPATMASYQKKSDGKAFMGFAMDHLSFLFDTPKVNCVVYNQLIQIPVQATTLNKLSLKRKRHAGIPDPANQMCMEDIDQLLAEVARDNQLLVNAHFNLIVCAEPRHLARACGYIESSLFASGIICAKNAYNQLELFRSALPGNGVCLKSYDSFLVTCEAAICLMFKEKNLKDESSSFLIRFTDRKGIPLAIDPADLPMQSGRISNRSKFVLGGSGSGKSFFMNALVQQYLGYNMDVVIIDTGHSYSGLCNYYNGKYLSYSEQSPITMNPFFILKEEYNIEKRDFLKTLIALLLKGADGEISQIEDTVIANLISGYYADYFAENDTSKRLDFDSFYAYSLREIQQIKLTERISFDLDEFRYVLKKFTRGGEFGRLLNQSGDTSLFTQPLVIFEIDAIREHKVLFPIVTLIIMDVFLQKMRLRGSQRKALILEEAWRAIASPLMANYLVYMYKTVRKFWGEAIVVTQELSDIVGNAVVKDSIIANSDTICLLDQSKFRENYATVSSLLSLSEVEQHKIFTINQLDNKDERSRFKEVYIRRGLTGEVYGVEVSLPQYLTFSTEKPEKLAVEHYVSKYGGYREGIDRFISEFTQSSLSLPEFITQVNQSNL